eukprot:Gb_29665 [translate_table: standard]
MRGKITARGLLDNEFVSIACSFKHCTSFSMLNPLILNICGVVREIVIYDLKFRKIQILHL